VQALSYFAGKEDDCKVQISEVLAHIDKRNLLPPLMVVDVLARNSNATLAVIKDYITKRLQQENQVWSASDCLASTIDHSHCTLYTDTLTLTTTIHGTIALTLTLTLTLIITIHVTIALTLTSPSASQSHLPSL
jgi:hypothetical protein